MRDFAAIDFETANRCRSSICSVGVVIVRNGLIVDKFYSLVRPVPNYYSYWNTAIHGLTRRDTDTQPFFHEVWSIIHNKIAGLPLIAHNRPFDESCLRAVFNEYGLKYPEYQFFCTLSMSRRTLRLPDYRLGTVAAACGYRLEQHHNAMADAEACAAIAMKLF